MATNGRNLRSERLPGRSDDARRRGTARTTTTLLLFLPAILVLLPSCIVLTLTLLPTLVAFSVDRSRDKWLALSVGPPNLCGALFSLVEVWRRGHDLGAAFEVLGDPYGWLAAFAGAAFGWTIYLAMPVIVAEISAAKQQLRLAQLRALQDALVEEWGRDVAEERPATEDWS